MLAGHLRKRVVIQSCTTTQDAFGQQSLVWSDVLAGGATGSALDIASVIAGALTTIECAFHDFGAGQLVTLAGITGAPNLSATFAVLNPTDGAFQVDYDSSALTIDVDNATATPVSGVPAEVLPLYAYEKTGRGQSSEVHQVTVRYDPALANPVTVAAMRILYGTRVLEVNGSINVEERNREINLNCTEGLTQG